MAANESSARNIFGEMRDLLGGFFGGRLDVKHEALVQGLFSLLGAMARADGVVSAEEAQFTNTLMDELKLTNRARQLASEAFALGCRRDFDPEQESLRLLDTFPESSGEIDRVYESLLRLAAADATIRPGERRFLEKITTGLGFDLSELDARLKRIMH
ncbi:MAG: TerB family tellurite resistance protein [Rudaea sp.]